MKSFRFENIWLLSHRDKRARQVKFHPHRNLILGRNHTGKTSLIRSLFVTLGAKPNGKLESWDDGSASLVEFSIDEKHYFALHQNGYRALFSANKELIKSTLSFTKWSELFCEITDFNLIFSDRESEVKQAGPDCFFLPFYINQDGSWQSEWNTFRGMQRYSSPWKAILEYFTGICPPSYYRAKAERDQEAKFLAEHKNEARLLERARNRFEKTLTLSGPKIHSENFEVEIKQLVDQVTILNKKQEDLRNIIVREQDLLTNLQNQIRLTEEALISHDKDSKFLDEKNIEPLICPVCHAEHAKSFIDILTYTDDARVLRDLISRLQKDADEVRQKSKKTQESLSALNAQYSKISTILDIRKGDLKFKDVVDSMGAESAFSAFELERDELQTEINTRLGVVDALDKQMKELRSKTRTKAILEEFREHYNAGRSVLKLPSIDVSKTRLSSRPDLSGSGGPRSILAYYAALWRTCNSSAGAYNIPIVIDSPNQQGQDDVNLPAVIKFIATDLPKNVQIIVGLESTSDLSFDKKLELKKQYSLLQEEEWSEVESIIEPMLQAMHSSITRDDHGNDV